MANDWLITFRQREGIRKWSSATSPAPSSLHIFSHLNFQFFVVFQITMSGLCYTCKLMFSGMNTGNGTATAIETFKKFRLPPKLTVPRIFGNNICTVVKSGNLCQIQVDTISCVSLAVTFQTSSWRPESRNGGKRTCLSLEAASLFLGAGGSIRLTAQVFRQALSIRYRLLGRVLGASHLVLHVSEVHLTTHVDVVLTLLDNEHV